MKTKNQVEPNKNFSIFGGVTNVLPFKLKIMKMNYLFVFSIALMVFSCTPKTETEKTADSDKLREERVVATVPKADPTCKYCVSGDTHEIDLSTVRILIDDFRIRFKGAVKNAGGVWSLNNFPTFTSTNKLIREVETIVFFPCVDKKILGLGKELLYLGVETKPCYDTISNCEQSMKTPGDSLVTPHTYFSHFPENDLMTDSAFKIFLHDPENYSSLGNLKNGIYPSEGLSIEMENFQNYFSKYYPDPIMVYGKGSTLDVLAELPGAAGIKYFFGYDNEQQENKIRVIFCAVDNNGRIIVPKKTVGGIEVDDWDHVFRESSRPRRP